ncbi:MAG: restriction endonuclease subunit S [Euryarchaeota archaeon]|nr:restriction endonuclease subunit S [Euryarchaeota archaeon]
MNWPMVQLQELARPEKGSIVSGPFGSNIGSRFFVEEGVPVIRGNNLTVGREKFIDEGFVFLTEEKASEFKNCGAIKDDIIFTAAGTIGQVGLIPENTKFEKYIISNKQLRVRIDTSKANPVFVYYWLTTREMNRHIIGLNNGGAVPLINLSIIRKLPVPLPPYEKQEKIVSIISAYDSLIENNHRRIQLLEQSARLLYREWFVHLRFPGHEHVRIIDGVPEGWETLELSDICSDIRETVKPEQVKSDTPYIGLEHMPRKSITLMEWGKSEQVTSNKFKYRKGDILFGKIRPYFHKVGLTFTDGITSSDAIVIRSKNQKLAHLLLMVVSSDHFVAVTSETVREGSKMPRADWKVLKKYKIMIPPLLLLENFNDIIKSITSQLEILSFQIHKLQQARDILLPRLMNGEITV